MYPVCTVLEELAGQLAAPVVTKETLAALDHELRAMRARHSASTSLAPECCPAWAAPTLRPVTEDW